MGLDVYVGPLRRYYAGNWETILQQVAKESGIPVRVMRPSQPELGGLAGCLIVFGRVVQPQPQKLFAVGAIDCGMNSD
jgi:hypothetical protein